jgi:hypothetical protein
MLGKEEISQPGIKAPTFSFRFGYLSTIIWKFRVGSNHVFSTFEQMEEPTLFTIFSVDKWDSGGTI